MSIELTWLGHATWLINDGVHRILLDPFLNDSPTAPHKASEVDADFILVSHGHLDHVADVAEIANRCDAMVIAGFEVAEWFANQQDVKRTTGMNIGGSLSLPFGSVKMTPAIHSSQLPDGAYGGVAGGFLIMLGDRTLYFACDTALFSDMQLLREKGIDAAILPIGDLYTMGPRDSVTATNYLNPKQVLPTHYNTWPPIEQDAENWAEMVRAGSTAEPVVLQPGQSHVIE
ncbi:metal-dependent hydrolase [Mariniblastus sp.]|jgi:L-ascorbate metabolism protein UlaG (beta-lactamase superfamily)|nr:metal-dependent hydrolase [Mariniblastus sp.]MDB4399647.1 metal-dependent hydrolase [bacterium]MDA7902667.1 metal-dependent hydrolase [Mariniblastus sp.]MDA7905841.1 metal-dependent hydrolase [Mariniblastus sp.]MDB4380773.1 metal-dependent hydrolase [Mariniblastus sp.]